MDVMDARRRELERAASLGDPAARARALAERVRAGELSFDDVRLAARLDDPTAAALAPCLEAWGIDAWSMDARARTAEALLTGARSVAVGPAPRPLVEPAGDTRQALRDLYHEVQDGLDAAGLGAWLDAHPGARLAPPSFRALATAPGGAAPAEDLWTLYAATRLLDLLVARPGHEVEALLALGAGLGASGLLWTRFHPFFHELVDVVPDDDDEAPPVLVDVCWPALVFGELLVLRSGVVVRAGRRWLDPRLVAEATLHFTYRRAGPRTEDPSMGSGSHSQWGTAARRDYATPDALRFNVDGDAPLETDLEDGLPVEAARELLVHRRFVRTRHTRDVWPYHWTLVAPRTREDAGDRLARELARGEQGDPGPAPPG